MPCASETPFCIIFDELDDFLFSCAYKNWLNHGSADGTMFVFRVLFCGTIRTTNVARFILPFACSAEQSSTVLYVEANTRCLYGS
jgi:hypothetical protein